VLSFKFLVVSSYTTRRRLSEYKAADDCRLTRQNDDYWVTCQSLICSVNQQTTQ